MKLRFIMILAFNILNAEIQLNFKNDPYGTHQPVLYEIANMTTGPIIEFGSGDNSTGLMHEICKKSKRLLITVDDDLEWINKFSQKYLGDGYEKDNSGWHKIFFVPGRKGESPEHWIKFLDNFDLLKNTSFDLCLIDQAPFLGRTETIMRVKDKIKYIILHDCDYFATREFESFGKTITPIDAKNSIPGIYDFSNTFKYFKVFFPSKPWPGASGPPTLLGSNFESNIPDIDYNKY